MLAEERIVPESDKLSSLSSYGDLIIHIAGMKFTRDSLSRRIKGFFSGQGEVPSSDLDQFISGIWDMSSPVPDKLGE